MRYVVENEFLDEYLHIVVDEATERVKYLTHAHHIIPVSYFQRNNLPVDNSSDNLVNLTHKNHILAHYYLYKCSKTKEGRQCNASAIIMMTNVSIESIEALGIDCIANDYSELREVWLRRQSESMMGHEVSDYVRKRVSECVKARGPYKRTEATRAKLRGDNNPSRRAEVVEKILRTKKERGHLNHSEETRRKIGASKMGRVCMYSPDKKRRFIRQEEVQDYIAMGFTIKHKNIENKKIPKEVQ